MIMLHRFICCLIILTTLCISCIPAAGAAEYTVASSGAEFTSIQAAINRALPGDTILVNSGVYSENIRLNKKINVTGIDSGNGIPTLEPVNKGNTIEILADGCRVEGFTIMNSESFNGIEIKSSENTIKGNTILNNAKGIILVSAMKNSIYGNTIMNNSQAGIAFEASNNNVINENIVIKNSFGIELDEYSLSNVIYRNNFENSQNVISKSATSVWYSPIPFTYTYLGNKKQSHMGNFWSDYHGKDKNGDGIGDTSYGIMVGGNPKAILESFQNIIDAFPLMDPIEYYYEVEPVNEEIVASQTMVFPTIQGISEATYSTIPIPNTSLTIPQTPSEPAESTVNGQPTGFLIVELIVLLFAGVVVLIIFRQLKHKESKLEEQSPNVEAIPRQITSRTSNTMISETANVPEVTQQKTSRTSGNHNGSSATIPQSDTTVPAIP